MVDSIKSPVWVIGTCDTKWDEIHFVRQILIQSGLDAFIVDVSTTKHGHLVNISAQEIADQHLSRKDFLQTNEGRGDAVACMSEALSIYMSKHIPAGIIGLGGSGGTALICAGLRALPVGVPKIMVSTVASGQVEPYVGTSDIMMLYSITDIAGINQISHTILSNAANALIGMVNQTTAGFVSAKPLLGMTMFGVTTKGVTQIMEALKDDFEILIFHATGTGGRSMEKLIDSSLIDSVIDMTITEICDLHMGGIMSAGEERMDAILRKKVPYVLSLGALDMVNFGGFDTVPEKYQSRILYKHNPQVTLMRTTPGENKIMAKWISSKLNRSEAPVRLLIPEKGVSALSIEGQPFFDPEADNVLFETLKSEIHQTKDRQIISLPYSINDIEFTDAVVKAFRTLNSSTES
ncbi:MAG: Tm-1-like ATP-binding domain-containing protein [Saprospiraceae bacterium]|nr:Tm-1-like ATP-binding domain-containing protein [Saprospiraceae bacterium]